MGVAVGVGSGVDVGAGVRVAAAVGRGEDVAVGAGAGDGVSLAVGAGVAVGIGAGEGVTVCGGTAVGGRVGGVGKVEQPAVTRDRSVRATAERRQARFRPGGLISRFPSAWPLCGDIHSNSFPFRRSGILQVYRICTGKVKGLSTETPTEGSRQPLQRARDTGFRQPSSPSPPPCAGCSRWSDRPTRRAPPVPESGLSRTAVGPPLPWSPAPSARRAKNVCCFGRVRVNYFGREFPVPIPPQARSGNRARQIGAPRRGGRCGRPPPRSPSGRRRPCPIRRTSGSG